MSVAKLFAMRLEFGGKAGLLAELVCGNPIKLPMSLYGNHLGAVCIYGVIATFSKQIEPIFLKIPDQVTTLD